MPSGSALESRGIGLLSMRLAGGGAGGIEPVVSLRGGLLEPKSKRPESLLQLATPKPINETAAKRGQMADRRDALMILRPYATNTSGRINYVAVNRALSSATTISPNRGSDKNATL
jgi:hypothetical protein